MEGIEYGFLDREAMIPTVSSSSGFRTGSKANTKKWKLQSFFDEEIAEKLVENGSSGNPKLFEFVMGWPINWTSLVPLKEVNIPEWTEENLLSFDPIPPKKFINHNARIKAVGNGQVPLCVYTLLKTFFRIVLKGE